MRTDPRVRSRPTARTLPHSRHPRIAHAALTAQLPTGPGLSCICTVPSRRCCAVPWTSAGGRRREASGSNSAVSSARPENTQTIRFGCLAAASGMPRKPHTPYSNTSQSADNDGASSLLIMQACSWRPWMPCSTTACSSKRRVHRHPPIVTLDCRVSRRSTPQGRPTGAVNAPVHHQATSRMGPCTPLLGAAAAPFLIVRRRGRFWTRSQGA